MNKPACFVAATFATSIALGCATDVSSLSVRIEYVADTCGGGPASSQFFEVESTVSLFVLDADQDLNSTIASDCADLPELPFRALNDLPQVLNENISIDPIPFGSRVVVQVAVHEPQEPCLPYRPGGDGMQHVPKFFGLTEPPVEITRDSELVSISMYCPQ